MIKCDNCKVILIDNEEICPSCGMVLINNQETCTLDIISNDKTHSIQLIAEEIPISKRIVVSPPVKEKSRDIKQYLLFIVLLLIPVVNVSMIIYYSFSDKVDPLMKRIARFALSFLSILLAVVIICIIIFGYNSVLKTVLDFTNKFVKLIF